MNEQNTHTYDASDIQVLEGLEPVRLRPGMYIGGTDEKAWHHLPVEILDNSIDEAVAGFAKKITVNLIDAKTIEITAAEFPLMNIQNSPANRHWK